MKNLAVKYDVYKCDFNGHRLIVENIEDEKPREIINCDCHSDWKYFAFYVASVDGLKKLEL